MPATRHVRGSNQCRIGVFADRVPGRAILLSVIDNLVKGASGQAVQNMNVAFGLAETTGTGAASAVPVTRRQPCGPPRNSRANNH